MSKTAIARPGCPTTLDVFPCGSIASAPTIRSSVYKAEPDIYLTVCGRIIGVNTSSLSWLKSGPDVALWAEVAVSEEVCYQGIL